MKLNCEKNLVGAEATKAKCLNHTNTNHQQTHWLTKALARFWLPHRTLLMRSFYVFWRLSTFKYIKLFKWNHTHGHTRTHTHAYKKKKNNNYSELKQLHKILLTI